MKNLQWYELFKTNVYVSEFIRVNQQYKSLLEYVAQETNSLDFDSCMEDQQAAVRIDPEYRYLSYVLLIKSGNQHIKLKVDLQNDFTTRNNLHPKYRPKNLHLLDKYIKIAAPKIPASEGPSFVQGDPNKGNGGRGGHNKRGGDDKIYEKKYWKDKECYKCGKEGHPESYCTKNKKDKDYDDNSTRSTSSRASKKKLSKDVNKMSRAFTTVNTQLKNTKEADSDLSDSEDEGKASHFQMAEINFGKNDSQFAQLDEKFEPRIKSIFNQNDGRNVRIKTKLYLREVIFMDIQLAMDLFWNQALVEKTTKSKTKKWLKRNGGIMAVSHQAIVND